MKRMRRLAALLLTAALLTAPARAAFRDVPESGWAYGNITRAAELGLIGGVGDGRFGLGRQVSRAEYATMLCRLMGWELISPEQGGFDDNRDPSRWYYSAIETAYAHGALLKLGAYAGVQDALTREEMAAMTVRALGYTALAGAVQDDCPFDDVTSNRGYIALAYHMGLMGGVAEGKFSPKTAAPREQAATLLLRVYDRLHAKVAQKPLSMLAPNAGAVYAEPLETSSNGVPICPRAPLERVYAAAVQAGEGGAVVLRAAPYDATARKTLTEKELAALLADEATQTYRSARYGSSYLTYDGREGSRIVWYETANDIAEKVALCRLLGISTVYVE